MRGRRWGWIWLVFALCSAQAMAQGVHKCMAPGGAVSYQDAPCEAPLHEADNWKAPPDPPPAARQRSPEAPSLQRQPVARAVRSGSTRIARTPAPSACEAARANRENTLERVGLKRTFDLLRRLDEQVRKACR